MSEKKRVSRPRIDELVYIRAIAALGILIIHASGGFAVSSDYGTKAMYLGIFLNQFFRYGSPIFMMISGLVIFYNYRSREEFDFPRFIKKKARFILLPYIIWTVLYFIYNVRTYNIEITRDSLGILVRNILLGEGFPHLYFIFLIFQFYLLVPIFLRFLPEKMEKDPFKLIFISFSLQLAMALYGRYLKSPDASGFLGIFNQYYWKTPLSWHYYFLLGATIGVNYPRVIKFVDKHIRGIGLSFIGVTILYLGQVYYSIGKTGGRDVYSRFGSSRPETMVYASIGILVLIYISRRLVGRSKFLENLGTYSFGIYFIHPMVLEKLKMRLFEISGFGYSRISSLFIFLVLGLGLTIAFVFLIACLDTRKLFLGNVPRMELKLDSKEEFEIS